MKVSWTALFNCLWGLPAVQQVVLFNQGKDETKLQSL